MARTAGSGWGAGPILYQVCEKCGKKKAYYFFFYGTHTYMFKCTYCKELFKSDVLIKQAH